MPKFGNDGASTGTTFGFSHVDLSTLGASEYTLVTIAVDTSGSTSGFERDMEACLGTIVDSCRKSPRCDNLLLRVIEFNSRIKEVHGFKLLQDCSSADYANKLHSYGSTVLYDATVSSVEGTIAQGKTLMDNDYLANGIVFIITDGEDNGSSTGPNTARKLLDSVSKTESLESLLTVLIGIEGLGSLQRYQTEMGINLYQKLQDATPSSLAKLAGFISKSISSQSQSLGTGGPSQALPTI